jgi:electron transport complex protein RnfD
MLGAWFMVTDMVTSPVTPKGQWIFVIGAGFLVVIIRLFGGLPEGVMYSILLMNSIVPLLNRWTRPKVFGQMPKPRTDANTGGTQ